MIRCYNLATDRLATEALEAKSGQVVKDPGRLSELQKLNRIQEILLVEPPSSKDEKEPATMAKTTRSRTRRVRFSDQPIREKLDIPSRARNRQDKNDQASELFEEADMRGGF